MTLSETLGARSALPDDSTDLKYPQYFDRRYEQADQLLTEQANERDQKRLEKTRGDKEYVLLQRDFTS